MKTKKFRRAVLVLLTAVAIGAGVATQASGYFTQGASLAGDPSQWGTAKKGSFDITAASDDEGKNGDVPVVPGLAGSAGGNAKITRESA